MWLTMNSLVAILLVADVGVSDGIVKPLAAAMARDARDVAQRIVSSSFFVLVTISGVLLLTFAAAYPFVDWASVFNVSSIEASREAGPSSAVLAGCVTMALVAAVVTRVNSGLQDGAINNFWQTSGSLLALAALVAGTRSDAGLPVLVLALTGVPVVATITNGLVLFGLRRPWLRPRLAAFDLSTARALLGTARWFFLSYAGYGCAMSAGPLIIAQILGPEHVTELGLPFRIFAVATMVVGLFVVPLWPAYADALERRDYEWVNRTLGWAVGAAAVIGLVVSTIVALGGDRILQLWVGSEVTTDRSTWVALLLWSTSESVNLSLSVFLWGAGKARFEALMRLTQATVAVSLMMALTRSHGVAGTAWGIALSDLTRLLPSAAYVAWLVRRLRVTAQQSASISAHDYSYASRG